MERQSECEGVETVSGLGASYPQRGDLWRRACKKAGILNLHIHDLRHTFASRLLEQGHRETDINKILGPSSLKTTKRYVHSSEKSRREAVESLSQICHTERQKAREFGQNEAPATLGRSQLGSGGFSAPRCGRGFRMCGALTASQRGRVAELKFRKNLFQALRQTAAVQPRRALTRCALISAAGRTRSKRAPMIPANALTSRYVKSRP